MSDHIVRGIDHVGITVPDIDDATRYLSDAFGAELAYDLITEPLSGAFIEEAVGVPPGTVLERIRMLRLGQSANIELFCYRGTSQHASARASDFGLQHFCVYVDDIDESARRVAAAGGVCLTPPLDLPGGDAGEGNRFAYTRAPWGTLIELVSYPSPQAYESTTSIRRWRPEASAERPT